METKKELCEPSFVMDIDLDINNLSKKINKRNEDNPDDKDVLIYIRSQYSHKLKGTNISASIVGCQDDIMETFIKAFIDDNNNGALFEELLIHSFAYAKIFKPDLLEKLSIFFQNK